ncbi:cell wall hydrolase [Stakelama saccharophila]|uniref:Cell wall hydrolase n=1 Tax=Stakelama saccharophila TaxID=3075605 RepID=A0ABZ0BCG9_9SPHN|nr:cell wall hydrolase [Stakelama sp. W311]WNO53994.1 cell wall hydrolase [Stakelama sp. W311]
MKLRLRLAAMAAVGVCAASTAGFTTPGFAFELDRTPSAELNAQPARTVPTPPPPIVPPELTPETTEDTVASVDGGNPATVDDDYASLSAAVAAQQMPEAMDRELTCLATGIYFEAKGEPLSGQLAVADVILNRAQSHRFPKSVCSVLTQRHQFSFVRNGRLPRVRTHSRAWRTAVAVAKVARRDLWESPVPDALFFHARYVSPSWRMAKVGTVGNHIFYR